MSRNRVYRRQQLARWKRRVAVYYGCIHQGNPRRIGSLSSARKPCSCWMCGNPRRHFDDVTPQERRAQVAEVEDAWR